jgi:hypothetical protein
MNAKVLFPTRRLAGAVALLLISGFSGPALAIFGGEPDDGKHPNVCTVIVYHYTWGLIPCSGTLIHERVILTAGHIVAGIEAGQATLYGVAFGQEVNVEDPTTWLEVSGAVYQHSRFDVQKLGVNPANADIAVLILKDPVTAITPATLPAPGFLDDLKEARQLESGPNGTRFTVVGYGSGLDGPPPELIYPVSDEGIVIRNAAQSGYLGLNDGWLFLIQNPAAGYGGVALGDSGGPTFWTDPATGQEVLVSITSWAGLATGMSYRIDTLESLAFIQQVIDSLEAESP